MVNIVASSTTSESDPSSLMSSVTSCSSSDSGNKDVENSEQQQRFKKAKKCPKREFKTVQCLTCSAILKQSSIYKHKNTCPGRINKNNSTSFINDNYMDQLLSTNIHKHYTESALRVRKFVCDKLTQNTSYDDISSELNLREYDGDAPDELILEHLSVVTTTVDIQNKITSELNNAIEVLFEKYGNTIQTIDMSSFLSVDCIDNLSIETLTEYSERLHMLQLTVQLNLLSRDVGAQADKLLLTYLTPRAESTRCVWGWGCICVFCCVCVAEKCCLFVCNCVYL